MGFAVNMALLCLRFDFTQPPQPHPKSIMTDDLQFSKTGSGLSKWKSRCNPFICETMYRLMTNDNMVWNHIFLILWSSSFDTVRHDNHVGSVTLRFCLNWLCIHLIIIRS